MYFKSLLKLLSLALVCGSVFPVALAADAMPTFTIAYFNGPCPPGWDSGLLAPAEGRTVLPTPRGGGAGGFVGEALASQEAPSHQHAAATGSITSPAEEFILVDGCCNDSLGHSGTYPMHGSTEIGHSGLPYIQYNLCLKHLPPSPGTVPPSGLLTFSFLPCEGVYSPYNAASGRFIVGLNPFGQPAATFGGPNLKPSEIRTHTHSMDGSMDFPEHEIAGGSGCCAHHYATSGSIDFSGSTTVDSTSSQYDSAVQAPYFTAFFCEVR